LELAFAVGEPRDNDFTQGAMAFQLLNRFGVQQFGLGHAKHLIEQMFRYDPTCLQAVYAFKNQSHCCDGASE
jgi:hypothetical protein